MKNWVASFGNVIIFFGGQTEFFVIYCFLNNFPFKTLLDWGCMVGGPTDKKNWDLKSSQVKF